MGVVYLAREVSLERPVAIKLLTTGLGERTEARERFIREARISARLSHPNIVPVHSVEDHGEDVFFVMAFIDGETLRERVDRRGPLPVGEASRMLQEVAWALGHAHGRGVVHRDIKPDNIILETETGRAVVTDFGIAQAGASSSGALEARPLGTPEFLSPEQALGRTVDGRSDLYSLGVTGYYALTGRLPFEAQGLERLLTKHLLEPPQPLAECRPDVPEKLAEALHRCLAKDPNDRFASAEEMAEAIAEARDDVPDEPSAIREVRLGAESLVIDGAGFGALSVLASLELYSPEARSNFLGFSQGAGFSIRLLVWLLTIGIVGSRFVQLVRKSRRAMDRGYSIQHLSNAFRGKPNDGVSQAGIDETGGLRAALAAVGLAFGFYFPADIFGELAPNRNGRVRGIPGYRAFLEFTALVIALDLLGLGWILAWNARIGHLGLTLTLVSLVMHTLLIILPVLLGRMIGASLIRRWPLTKRLWATFWKGRFGAWFFRLAGTGLNRESKVVPASKPTEMIVAGAAADLFRSLPPEYKERLGDLPALVVRLEAAAGALRRREGELGTALRSAGTIADPTHQTAGDVPPPDRSGHTLQSDERLTDAKEILASARSMVQQRLSSTVAALENLRLGLLRLQAGMGSPQELTADIKAALEIGREVDALLDGERRVEDYLHPGLRGPGRGSASERNL